jgi:DNA-3-methyladenine glycosylase I
VTSEPIRCPWCGTDPLYRAYHDQEWGRPSRDEHHLFEMLTLEGAQAGLSWLTILRKREGYRQAFADFDPRVIVDFDAARVGSLLIPRVWV